SLLSSIALAMGSVQKMVKWVSKAVLEALSADALNVGQNNSRCANQIVMHYHVHVIPRWCLV
ncbi:HIT domain-containing protein, partial [Klebsiella aerogenes]|uniref:HIT domain-containing protein n=1 Tax=Klebsiella aerogenes TaxID=548 RepID=UPI001953AE25